MSATREEIEGAVREFQANVQAVEGVLDALAKSLSMAPECALYESVWAVISAYRDSLDKQFAIGGWLEWWQHECRFGESHLQAGLPGQDMRLIATLDDFVTLVCDDAMQVQREEDARRVNHGT